MVATSHLLGHKIIYKNEKWVYEDGTTTDKVRSCTLCDKQQTSEGHDRCIQNLPGVGDACCGHGAHEGYIIFNDGRSIRGYFKVFNNFVEDDVHLNKSEGV